jgi:anti-anti-sigma factor
MVRALAVVDDAPAPEGVMTSIDHEVIDVESRIEDWLVCYLDDRDPEHRTASFAQMLGAGTFLMPRSQKRKRAGQSSRRDLQARHWARIAARRVPSVVVVKLLDQLLIKDNVIEELAAELDDLIRIGDRRIVLNFAQVERMSSQIVAVVTRIHHCCASVPGGMLKLCGLRPDVADVFRFIGLGRSLVVCPDEQAALTGPWPLRPGPRPLPVSILSALSDHPRRHDPEGDPGQPFAGEETVADGTDDPAADSPPSFVWLIVENGLDAWPQKGCVIPISRDRFVIGSGPECDLHLTVAGSGQRHAAIERRGRFLRLVDLGSREVTAVNGRVLDASASPLRNGDRIRLGRLVFKVVVINGLGDLAQFEDLVLSWLHDEDDDHLGTDDVDGAVEPETDEIPIADQEEEASCTESGLRYKVVQEVLVVTPKITEVDDESAVEKLRSGLAELSTMPLPGRVVLDLSHVGYINSRWLGALMAYLLRLERNGGSLRICELHSRVLTVLEQFRLTALIEVFATVEDAVLTAWD